MKITVFRGTASEVSRLANEAHEPDPVQWLLRSGGLAVEGAVDVDVGPHPEPGPAIERPSNPRQEGGESSRSGPIERPGPAGPSLVDLLRMSLAVPLESLLPGPETVLDWPGELLPYQLDGVLALMQRDRILLADDMGLGKTVQAAAAIRIMCVRREIERTLLVVPASLRLQWRRELALWAPELQVMVIDGPVADRAWQWASDAHITIVSYDTLRTDFTPNPQSAPRKRVWDLVVLDEAQKIKNRQVETSVACKLLDRRRSWAMTGTPIENSIEDLASIMEFVDHVHGEPQITYTAGEALFERHRQLQLRRRKSDVLTELPPKKIINLLIPLTPDQRRSYDRAEQEGVMMLRQRGTEVTIQNVLELIVRLKQICNFCPSTGRSAKLEDIRSRLEVLTAEGHRALVFSQFVDADFGVEAVCRGIESFNPLAFVGSMSGGERDRVIQKFKSDSSFKTLVLSLLSGGVGLNLQEASYVFHLDRWWNPAIERQAEDRSHRMGQTYPVTVFKYTSIDTIEERIQVVLVEKQKLFDAVVDDVTLDLGVGLNKRELFGLFGLAPSPSPSDSVRKISGLELEDRTAALLRRLGWSVETTPRSRDGGVDLVATRSDELGIEDCLYVQCKDHARPVGVDVVRELLGVLPPHRVVRPVLVSPAGVTGDAQSLARERNVLVWNEERLLALEN